LQQNHPGNFTATPRSLGSKKSPQRNLRWVKETPQVHEAWDFHDDEDSGRDTM